MKNFYNIRGKDGKFTTSFSSKSSLRMGSLYSYKGTVVRTRKLLPNGTVLISVHSGLFGFAKPEQLQKIDKDKVDSYLEFV